MFFSATNFTTLLASLSLSPALERPAFPTNGAGPPTTQAFIQTSVKNANALPACSVAPYDVPAPAMPTFAPYDPKIASVYRFRRQQAVNLGSWFVQENWMEPSLFTCSAGNHASEYDVASGWTNSTSSRALLEKHWDTWITESDFAYLHSIGINTVRLPIGFWSLGPEACDGTPFEGVRDVYGGSWVRVLGAIRTAGEWGIGVLVDLHGAPGSQNGQSHSGMSDGRVGLFESEAYMNKTIDVLANITQQLVSVNNVVGIQLLNEPVNHPILPAFYNRTLSTLRSLSPLASSFPFYIHDAFSLPQYSSFIGARTDFVVEDHHSYFVYTPSDQAESAAEHTHDVNTTIASQLGLAAKRARGNLVIDEWSCALAPSSLANSNSKSDAAAAEAQRAFCTQQMETYSLSGSNSNGSTSGSAGGGTGAGWAFWSYTMENCDSNPGWCFKQAVNRSLPATFWSYPNVTRAPADPLALKTWAIGGDGEAGGLNLSLAALELGLGDNVTAGGDESSSWPLFISGDATYGAYVVQKRDEAKGMGMGTRPHQVAIGERRAARRASILAVPPSPVASTSTNTAPCTSPSASTLPSPLPSASSPNTNMTAPAPAPDAPFSRLASLTAHQTAISRGYADGLSTSKVFAQYGLSRLGFVQQYISDTLVDLVAAKEIDEESEEMYASWFRRGLADGEAGVMKAINGL